MFFIWTGLVEYSVEYSGLKPEWITVIEKNLSVLFNIGAEAVNSLSRSSVEESVEAYKKSLTETDRMYHRERVKTEIKTALEKSNVSPRMIPLVAELLTEITLTGSAVDHTTVTNSIKVCCRCKTVEALYGLKQLIDSGKMANYFSRIMSCLTNEQVTVTVNMSEKDFNKCLMSLTDAAG